MRKLTVFLTGLAIISAAHAATGFLTGERIDGMYKICFYDVLGSTYTITVKAFELCPLSIQVD